MPIVTECTNCDRPLMVHVGPGRFAPVECDDCGRQNVVEMTRMGGATYPEDVFCADVLPGLEDIERIDHPDADVYIYGNPESVETR